LPKTLPAVPTVTRLFTTSIKGFNLSEPSSVTLNANGAVGDCDFFLVDDKQELISITRTGAFASWRAEFDPEEGILTLTSRDDRVLEDKVVEGDAAVFDFWGSRDVRGQFVGDPWPTWLSEIAGQPVSLIRATQSGDAFDETAVTMLSEESVAELARATKTDSIDIRRFRMLINIAGGTAYEEEGWFPKPVRIGSAILQMRGPVPRCNATTRDPDTGKKDLKTLQLIAESRGKQPNEFGEDLNMGAYAEVIEPGVVSVGDRVELG